MPSRIDIPEPPPSLPGPGESGEDYERRLDEHADRERQRPVNLYLPSWYGSRDGDHLRHFESLRGATSETQQLVSVKKRNDGPANSAYRHQVEDYIGEVTDDNTKAVYEGERAQMMEESGQGVLLDTLKKIVNQAYECREPYNMFWVSERGFEHLSAEADDDAERVVVTHKIGSNPENMETKSTREVSYSDVRGFSRIGPGDNVVYDDE